MYPTCDYTFHLPKETVVGVREVRLSRMNIRQISHVSGSQEVHTMRAAETIGILLSGEVYLQDNQRISGTHQLIILPENSSLHLKGPAEIWLIEPRLDIESMCFYRRKVTGPAIYDMAKLQAPSSNPRLKMLQSDRLSLNWVAYHGPRTTLSPHVHEDFSQVGIVVAGQFLHHLRLEWGKDVSLWRSDVHQQALPGSIIEMPAHLIHTCQGIDDGENILLDLFSPPREDFIAKGWMLNAEDYIYR